MIGKLVSHFRVLEQIGQGGMGEVFLALDTKLNRKVALKFLPEFMEDDPVARKRFLREAKSAALLDHPFIAYIYEIGDWEGRGFLAMEYLKGQTLQDRLKQGRLPLEEALQIAIEVSEALGVAHAEGMIHRDLKPSNIMLTEGGHAKVMDFGLAKFVELTPRSGVAAEPMTGLTGSGVRLGTIPYMSPEQLRGDQLDTRSDIFSFGIVLYEMISGNHPFKRTDSFETAGAILREDPPPLSHSEPRASDVVSYVLGKMLAKKPDQRYQSVLEIRTDLFSLLNNLRNRAPVDFAAYARKPYRLITLLPWLLTVITLIGLLSVLLYQPEDSAQRQTLHVELGVGSGRRVAHYYRQGIALSPDGSTLAIVTGQVENPYLFPAGAEIELRRLDEWQSRKIQGTLNGFQPFFSPDGEWLGFSSYLVDENTWFLKKVRVDGGEPITLCECEARWGATWTKRGTIVLGTGSGGLLEVSEAGGEPQELTTLDSESGEVSHRLPSPLPNGEAILFTAPLDANSLGSKASISALSLETGDRVQLVDGWDGRYVPTGHLVFAREGRLYGIAFDPGSLRTEGPEVPLLEGITQSLFTVNPMLRTGGLQMSFADSGLMVYLAGSVFPEIKNTVVWVDRNEWEEAVDVDPRNFFTLRASRDSQHILLTTLYPPQDIWLYDTSRKTTRRQTYEGNGIYAIWGPGPEQLTFSSDLLGPRSIYTKEIDSGPAKPDLLFDGTSSYLRPSAWSQDGRFLTFVEMHPEQGFDIGYLSRNGEKKLYLATRFSEQYPEISPNGKWMLYTTDESGRQEVYIRPFPGPGRSHQISTDGGYEPGWSDDGSEIYYRWRQEFFTVSIQFDRAGNEVRVSEPRKLFEGDYGSSFAVRSFDLAPNGRFLMLKRPDAAALEKAVNSFFPDRIQVVSNWFDEIQRKLPRP